MSVVENISIPVILIRILTTLSYYDAYFEISFDTVSICWSIASMDAIDVSKIILSTVVTWEDNDLSHWIHDLLNIYIKPF